MVDTETGEILASGTTAGDLVPVDNMAALDTLTPEAREIALTSMLTQARAWLAHAVEASAPARDIADFKAWVATAADAARRVQVSKEIQLDADEMVRRSERVLGLAIRKGQEEGAIRKSGQRTGNQYTDSEARAVSKSFKASPTDFAASSELASSNGGIYDVTDDVTDEKFEEAITEAKAEGNLSRANVVRKVKGTPKPEGQRHELQRRTRHIDPTRVIRETVATLDGLAMGVGLLHGDYSGVDLDEAVAQEWATSLTNSLRTLNRLSKSIKEMTHDHS